MFVLKICSLSLIPGYYQVVLERVCRATTGLSTAELYIYNYYWWKIMLNSVILYSLQVIKPRSKTLWWNLECNCYDKLKVLYNINNYMIMISHVLPTHNCIFLHFYLYWATFKSFVQFYLAKLWSRTSVQLQILHDFLVLNEIYLYHWMPTPEIFIYTKYYSYLYMAWQYVIFTMQILSSYQPVICRYISMRSLFHFSISSPHSALYISITGELNCWCFNQWAGVISCLTACLLCGPSLNPYSLFFYCTQINASLLY
jgi:hypothetical protein